MKLTLSTSAVVYTVQHIMRVAAPKLSYTLMNCEQECGAVQIQAGTKTIQFAMMSTEQVSELLAGRLPAVETLSFDGQVTLPIFVSEGRPFAKICGDKLVVLADILTVSFFLLSRKEEQVISNRDKYNRFLYEFSLGKKYGWTDVPIIDEWAMLLRQQMMKFFSEDELGVNIPTLRPTHDLDEMRRFPNASKAMRSILGGDLMLRKNVHLAWQSMREYIKSRKHPELDPCILGAEKLLTASEESGFCSEFYFMGLQDGEDDFRYDANSLPSVSYFAALVKEKGMVCGFHSSRLTIEDKSRFREEKQRVSSVVGEEVTCGRQHYLCFDAMKTPRIWADSGMKEDSTLGYADREGFRCGTCFPYPLYDLEDDRPLLTIEHPLTAMEVAMDGRGMPNEEMLSSLKKLFLRSKAVGGEFVILWHNDNTVRDWKPRFDAVYRPFLKWAGEQLHKERNDDK